MGLFHRHKWSEWASASTEGLAKLVGAEPEEIEWRMCLGCGTSETRRKTNESSDNGQS